jgi:hypothetical protein
MSIPRAGVRSALLQDNPASLSQEPVDDALRVALQHHRAQVGERTDQLRQIPRAAVSSGRTASNPSVSWRTGRDAVTLLEQIAGEIRDA